MKDKEVEEFTHRAIGQKVTFRRLAGNTLILYLNCFPGENHGYSVWIEPTWHCSSTSKVLVGSRQAQVDDEQELDEISELMDVLDKAEVESISIDPVSHDLHILFEHGYSVKTFVSDPTDELIWYIKDRTKGLKLYASPNGVEIVHV